MSPDQYFVVHSADGFPENRRTVDAVGLGGADRGSPETGAPRFMALGVFPLNESTSSQPYSVNSVNT